MIPRSPVPLKPPTTGYEIEGVAILRKDCPELAELTDGEIATLWEWHSCEFWCAGWMVRYDGRLFLHEISHANPNDIMADYKTSFRREEIK